MYSTDNVLHNRSQPLPALGLSQPSPSPSYSLSVPLPVPVSLVSLQFQFVVCASGFPQPVSSFSIFTSFASELRHLKQTINATRHLKANVRQGRAKAINLSSLSERSRERQHPQHTLCCRSTYRPAYMYIYIYIVYIAYSTNLPSMSNWLAPASGFKNISQKKKKYVG